MTRRRFKHYKSGGTYELLYDSRAHHPRWAGDGRNPGPFVVYKDSQGETWFRPASEFFGSVFDEKRQVFVQRFVEVKDGPTTAD